MPEPIPDNTHVLHPQQQRQQQQPIGPQNIPINMHVYPQQQQQQFAPPMQQARRQNASAGIASCLFMTVLVIGGIMLLFWLVPLSLGSSAYAAAVIAVIVVVVILFAIFASKGWHS